MTKKEFRAWLESRNACEDALKWLGGRSLEEAWAQCPRGDWMLWLAQNAGVGLRPLTLAKGRCAELVLHLMKDDRSREAVAVAIRFGQGDASREELDYAATAAYAVAYATAAYATTAAAYAAYAAYAATAAYAAYAAYAATAAAAAYATATASAAAYTASYTAYAAADAADAASYTSAAAADAADAAKEETLLRCADICRECIPVELLTEKLQA